MYGFLLRPRWIGLVLGVIVLVTLFSQLAEWQFGRNAERSATNELIEQNLSRPARPLTEVVEPGVPLDPGHEWLPVRARGRYDAAHQLLVRYRHLGGEPGFEVLTPLVTDSGAALLVDRGWVPVAGGSTEPPEVPAPPTGEVTVTGRIRRSENGSEERAGPESGQVRFIDVQRIAETLPYPVFGGYAELTGGPGTGRDSSRDAGGDRKADGESAMEIVPLPPPELDPGPFFSYGVQWWLFAAIAAGGLIFLAYDEAHGGVLRERLRNRERRRSEDRDPEDDDPVSGPVPWRRGTAEPAAETRHAPATGTHRAADGTSAAGPHPGSDTSEGSAHEGDPHGGDPHGGSANDAAVSGGRNGSAPDHGSRRPVRSGPDPTRTSGGPRPNRPPG